jgi:hypothetical protein
VVYENLTNPLGNFIGGFHYEETADDMTLSSGGVLESITVAYAGFNFDGDEFLTVRIYAMDGPATPGSFGFNTPGTELFAGTQMIAETPSGSSTVTFVDATGTVVLPTIIGVGFLFTGVEFDPTGAGANAGPLLYDPPTIGTSLDDYWLRGYPNPADDWSLFTFGGSPPANFGIRITAVMDGAVPEPTAFIVWTVLGLTVGRRIRGLIRN